jgi:hypothetical protein
VIGDGVTQRFSRFFSHFPKRKREIGMAKMQLRRRKTWGIFSVEGSLETRLKKQKLKRNVLKHGTLKEYLTV